jgi:putative thioredoxin
MNMQNPINPSARMQNGVIDLSTLGAKPAAANKVNSPFVVDVVEATIEAEVILKSKQVPVIVALGSNRHAASIQVWQMLELLTIEFAGKIVLAKVDTDVSPEIAAAFQAQTVPSVLLVLNGQVQPLFNDVPQEAQVRSIFQQVVEVATKAGLSGVDSDSQLLPQEAEAEKPIDPRFVKAFEAMEAGEWDIAEAVFREVLNNAPADEEAKIGVIQVGLFKRTDGIDFDAVIGKSLENLETYLEVADSLMMLGQISPAFELLIAGVKIFESEEREKLKQRLLDFFVLVGEVDEVRTARRELTNALF